MGIIEDEIIAACLLHDVIEDCGKTIGDLPVSEETKELVRLLTCEKTNDDNRAQIVGAYYQEIVKNPKSKACWISIND